MTLFRRTWLLYLWLVGHAAAFAQLHEMADGSDGPVKAAHVTAELVASVSGKSGAGFALAILLALTGGLVLNLMPCVFPVLFLKALSLAGSATEDRRTQRLHGVSYTARILAWCLSCKVNLRPVLHDASVERELEAKHYVLLPADWTRYAPEITRQLAFVSRNGVPTCVIYPAQSSGRVQVLPELLTRSAVLSALTQPQPLHAGSVDRDP